MMKTIVLVSIAVLMLGCAPIMDIADQPSEAESKDAGYPEFVGISELSTLASDYQQTVKVCHHTEKLALSAETVVDVSGFSLSLVLENLKTEVPRQTNEGSVGFLYDSAEILINRDWTVTFLAGEFKEIQFNDGSSLIIGATLLRDNHAIVCILADEAFDLAYCNMQPETDKHDCFDNLGYLFGEAYCEGVDDEYYRTVCIRGARGENG